LGCSGRHGSGRSEVKLELQTATFRSGFKIGGGGIWGEHQIVQTERERLVEQLRAGRKILVFTGAGISTGSGIPDFRGPEGVWKTRDPNRYTLQNYVADPEVRRERWLDRLDSPIDTAQPNAAHLAIADLQRAGRAPVVVTQNI